jgi:hypothetical protein
VAVKLDQAKRALMEAKTIQDAKKIADLGKAMLVYSRQQKLGKEVEQHANAIFLEAIKRVGEMMKATGPQGTNERSDGGRPKKTGTKSELVSKPTLAEIGLTKKRRRDRVCQPPSHPQLQCVWRARPRPALSPNPQPHASCQNHGRQASTTRSNRLRGAHNRRERKPCSAGGDYAGQSPCSSSMRQNRRSFGSYSMPNH